MAQHPIELILMRELADTLLTPAFVVDRNGDLVFYNEPAEELLGLRFDETGGMPLEEWATLFSPQDAEGRRLDPRELPLVDSLRHGRPGHDTLSIRGLDGVAHALEVTATPLIGRGAEIVGAAALFWEALE